jgi:hypothetical protein
VKYERLETEAPAMRLPRVRFTVRTMIAVAVSAFIAVAVTALRVESVRCRSLSRLHRTQAAALDAEAHAILRFIRGCPVGCEDLLRGRMTKLRGRDHHAALAAKYERAAARPWLLLKPDPPEPK